VPNCERYRKSKLIIRIGHSHARFLSQEQKRLRTQYGIKLSQGEIVEVLIEQHKLRFIQVAEEDPDSLIWFYRNLKGLDSD
jgi:hypothetical protein